MNKILVLSDLHLDHSNFTPQHVGADIIVLAGDIAGRRSLIEDFFYYKMPKGIPTIYVAGNHEYEHHDFEEQNTYLKNICDEFNIHYLYNETVEINGIRFLGTPLFSNLKGFYTKYFPGSFRENNISEELIEWLNINISDFRNIKYKNSMGGQGVWTVADMLNEFDKAYSFLYKELNERNITQKTVVVTHFAPTFDFSQQENKADDKSSYWCNHLPELINMADCWINGHIHTPKNQMIGNCQLVCNPRGYSELVNLPQHALFNPNFLLEV